MKESLPEHAPSTFKITLIFEDGFPAGWRLVLDSAAQRWQRVIRAPLPAVPLNDPVQDSVYRWRQFPTDIYLGP